MAKRTIIPDRMVGVLWDLYQKHGMTVPQLAVTMGTRASHIRAVFQRAGYRFEEWNEAELAAMHAEYLAGEFVSKLAKRRGRKSGELLGLWEARGWEIRPVKKYIFATRRWPADQVAAMHADHLAGMGLSEIERKYGRGRKTVRGVFKHRGLQIIERKNNPRLSNGCFPPLVPKTEAEIQALIEAATKIEVPADLRSEWRKWPLTRKADFLHRLRAHLRLPNERPALPFSSNLRPFDYGSQEAWDIVNAGNAGLTSRSAAFNLKLPSQGVIHQGLLYFWVPGTRIYQRGIPWTPEHWRPSLHRVIWEQEHGPVPPGMCVCTRDGNPNNLDPSNLELRTKNDVCRVNQARAILRKSREKTAILLRRSQQPPTTDRSHDLLRNIAQG